MSLALPSSECFPLRKTRHYEYRRQKENRTRIAWTFGSSNVTVDRSQRSTTLVTSLAAVCFHCGVVIARAARYRIRCRVHSKSSKWDLASVTAVTTEKKPIRRSLHSVWFSESTQLDFEDRYYSMNPLLLCQQFRHKSSIDLCCYLSLPFATLEPPRYLGLPNAPDPLSGH